MRVAIVGPCASGKSTIVDALRERGYDAYVVGQEHSEVAALWRRQNPDRLVMLEVGLETIRARRGEHWPGWIYDLQQRRLADARQHADISIDTGKHSVEEVVDCVIRTLGGVRPAETGPGSNGS